ncbi:MAG: hypothetical protein U9R06_00760 [Patescibacteria group bacterium]|nr:hypothetical protein [Patescibacteria group bacterium]
MFKQILYGIVIFAAVFILLGDNIIPAQAQVGIKITPVRLEELVDPGETINAAVKVVNNSNETKTFYAYLRDFKAEGELGRVKLIAPGSEEGCFVASWIDITAEGTEFKPGEEKSVSYSIHVPADTGPGGYYGAILFGTVPPKLSLDSEDKGAGMAIAQQAGSLVLLHVKGDVIEDARIREFNTNKRIYGTPYDVNFLVRIENLGNVHVKPHGLININNMFGKEVGAVRVNDNGGNILPNTIRRFEYNWTGDMGFGRYKASLGMTYGTPGDEGGQGKQTLYTEISFWIIPWRIVIPILLGLVLFGASLFLLLRLYRNKAVKKAMERAGMGRMRYVLKFQGPSPALHLSLILLVVFIVIFLIVGSVYLLFFA